jgi:hypothetical protein
LVEAKKVLDVWKQKPYYLGMQPTKAPQAERIAAHRAAMKRLGEILAARKAARQAQVSK